MQKYFWIILITDHAKAKETRYHQQKTEQFTVDMAEWKIILFTVWFCQNELGEIYSINNIIENHEKISRYTEILHGNAQENPVEPDCL